MVEWIDTYGIHQSRILSSSYRKLVWVRLEPATIKVRSNALTDWAIRPLISIRSQCSHCILIFFFESCQIFLKGSLTQIITLVAEWINTSSIYHWRTFRSCYKKLTSVGFETSTTEFYSDARSQSQLCKATLVSSLCSVFTFHFGLCERNLPHHSL